MQRRLSLLSFLHSTLFDAMDDAEAAVCDIVATVCPREEVRGKIRQQFRLLHERWGLGWGLKEVK